VEEDVIFVHAVDERLQTEQDLLLDLVRVGLLLEGLHHIGDHVVVVVADFRHTEFAQLA